MSADKELRLMQQQFFSSFRVVVGWRSSDMPHHHFYILTDKYQLLGIFGADILSIDVAVDAPDPGLTVSRLTRIRDKLLS